VSGGRPTLLIAGYFGYANTGDEAILAAMLQDMRARRPDLEFIVVSGDPEQTAATYGVRAIAADDIAAMVDAAQAVDGVLLGGGGIFHDYWGCPTELLLTRGHGKIPFFAAFPLLAALTGRPCMIYGAGVGPLLTSEGSRLTRTVFEQASLATVRDEESLETLREIGLEATEVRVTADPAFGLRIDDVAGRKILADLGVDPGRPCVAVCLRQWTIGVSESWSQEVAASLDAFVAETGAGLVFLPFHTLPYEMTDDVAAAERVVAGMTERSSAVVLRGARAPEVVAGIVAACDLVVGMRLHAVIFAAIAGIPAVGLVYDPKVSVVMDQLGLGDYAVALGDGDRLATCMAMAWRRRKEIRAELARLVVGLQAQAAENAALAVSLLEPGRRRPARMPEVEWLAGFVLAQTRKLAEQQAVAERLAAEEAARSEESTVRTGEVEALRQEVEVLGAQVSALTGSVAWRLVEKVRGVRERLAPRGSRRNRVVRGGLGALATLAEQGIGGSLAAGRRSAEAWLERHRHEAQLARILAKHRGRRAVIFLPTVDWGWMMQRPQQLARALAARGCLVFYVTERTSTDRVDGFAEVGDGLYLCADLRRLRRVANPIVIAANLRYLAEVPRLRHPFVIYDVLDVLEISGPVTPAKRAAHAQLLAGAGMVMVTSRLLLEEARRVRSDAVLVPNACEPAHFAPDGRRAVPEELADIVAAGGPIAGYYGALAEWFDYDVLDAVAERLPHWWFVLIGPDYDGTAARLPARNNVRWLGLKDYASLPAYLQTFDVAMIPFVINEITRATSPVKLFEYMAGDRPIVTTPIEEALGYASVDVADGPEAFAAALEMAYTRRDDPAARRVRAAERDANTWAARAAAILDGVASREAEPQDVAVVLAGVPIDDSGGGHRPAELTLELLARGWRVVYVHTVVKHKVNTGKRTELDLTVSHPLLGTCDLADFDVPDYLDNAPPAASASSTASGRLLVLVECPHPAFERAIAALRARGARVLYDLIDDWTSGLGAGWYDKAVEDRIAARSHVLVATSTNLVTELAARTGRSATLVPNAANRRIFDASVPYARPVDLPAGRPQIMYVGALWGEWFDWELVRRVAEAYPTSALTLIGDYGGQCPYPPPRNMFFLGLKAQRDLPAYLAHADVGLIPFVVTPLTQAMSHLTVFEYLAMGLPVVATPSVELTNLPHVHLADDAEVFVAAVGRVAAEPVDREALAAFTHANTWEARVDTLLAAVFPQDE
jgi:polysaccharide pyruvyl transferase CsaB